MNTKLAQTSEHQTRTQEVLSSILIGGNFFLAIHCVQLRKNSIKSEAGRELGTITDIFIALGVVITLNG